MPRTHGAPTRSSCGSRPTTRTRSSRRWLRAEGSTLVIDPDPVRAARLVALLLDEGRDVAVIRSDHSAADLTAAWDRRALGACVIVGGRTAVWAPVPDLATVIVVDEGDEALEEERAPTWNARDVAVERARRAGATVRMITPAPTLDALERAGCARVRSLRRGRRACRGHACRSSTRATTRPGRVCSPPRSPTRCDTHATTVDGRCACSTAAGGRDCCACVQLLGARALRAMWRDAWWSATPGLRARGARSSAPRSARTVTARSSARCGRA